MTDRHLGDSALQALEGRERARPDRARHDQQEFLVSRPGASAVRIDDGPESPLARRPGRPGSVVFRNDPIQFGVRRRTAVNEDEG
jgi:hypothetical protein